MMKELVRKLIDLITKAQRHCDFETTYLDGQIYAREQLEIMHSFLYVLTALNCATNCVHLQCLPICIRRVNRGPHYDHGITNELYNIATVLV